MKKASTHAGRQADRRTPREIETCLGENLHTTESTFVLRGRFWYYRFGSDTTVNGSWHSEIVVASPGSTYGTRQSILVLQSPSWHHRVASAGPAASIWYYKINCGRFLGPSGSTSPHDEPKKSICGKTLSGKANALTQAIFLALSYTI